MSAKEPKPEFDPGRIPPRPQATRKTRTLYVRDEDQEIWDQAKELAGESLSTFVTAQLKGLVEEKKSAQQGFEKLVIKFVENKVPRAKAFFGRWIIAPQAPFVDVESDPEMAPDNYAVATTARNNIAVFNFWGGHYDPDRFLPGVLNVFESIEEAASAKNMPDDLGTEIIRRIGVEVQLLDI